jgi:hypothetical protein
MLEVAVGGFAARLSESYPPVTRVTRVTRVTASEASLTAAVPRTISQI